MPFRYFIYFILAIFVVETLVMALISFLPEMTVVKEAFLDSTILTLLLVTPLYLLRSKYDKFYSPIQLIVIVTFIIFISEGFAMFFLDELKLESSIQAALLDSTILVALITPVLYLLKPKNDRYHSAAQVV